MTLTDACTSRAPSVAQRNTTGKERDTESGNDYFNARYYGSSMGRFMSPDPLPWIQWQNGNRDDQQKFEAYIANPQNFNMYAYVLNNPLNHTDPTGMNACGTKDDSTCKVTVTIRDRSTDSKGHYNDQFTGVKNQGNYNATAVVNVNGKDVGTFLIKTTPSDSNSGASLASGVYSGEQYDSDLGLYYLRARYYNPVTGRFLSRDPLDGQLSDPKSLHKYLYAGGDPVNVTDPTGRAELFEQSFVVGGSLVAYPGLVAAGASVAEAFCGFARFLAYAFSAWPSGAPNGTGIPGPVLKLIPYGCTAIGF
jgi:RHS repeat-associated protein